VVDGIQQRRRPRPRAPRLRYLPRGLVLVVYDNVHHVRRLKSYSTACITVQPPVHNLCHMLMAMLLWVGAEGMVMWRHRPASSAHM
jgi:hypothetical protein